MPIAKLQAMPIQKSNVVFGCDDGDNVLAHIRWVDEAGLFSVFGVQQRSVGCRGFYRVSHVGAGRWGGAKSKRGVGAHIDSSKNRAVEKGQR
jgi:hypothetical protein